MGGEGGGVGIIMGWIISGIGMICVGLVFENLRNEGGDVDGGIYSYGERGFGDFIGF